MLVQMLCMNLIQFKVVALYDGIMATTTGMSDKYRLFSTAGGSFAGTFL
jgi:hypothetical protein